MSVKEHLQALIDEGQVRVEKIGSGNWYWSFPSEEAKGREKTLGGLKKEKESWMGKIRGLGSEISTRKLEIGDDGREEKEREGLLADSEKLKNEVARLKGELASYEDGDPKVLKKRRGEVERMRERAELWTENCWILEGYVRDELRVDRDGLEGLRREAYGGEYVEGEGLGEL